MTDLDSDLFSDENIGKYDKDYDPTTQSLSLSRAAELLGVTTKTLRNWDEKKKINVIRTPGGHRRVPIKEISRLLAGETNVPEPDMITHPHPIDLRESNDDENPFASPSHRAEENKNAEDITPSEYISFIKAFGLENIDFLKPEKTEIQFLPETGIFNSLNRDQINFLTRQIVHKLENVLACRLSDVEYLKLANIVAIVHERGTPTPPETSVKVQPGVPSSLKLTLGYLRPLIAQEIHGG